MPTQTLITLRAAQQVDDLRRSERRRYDQFLLELRANGCRSLHYRLTGDALISKICIVHLAGALRVAVAFSLENSATILLVARHDDTDPFADVYAQLYRLAGLDEPPVGDRSKPPCCDAVDGQPPVADGDLLDDFVKRARQLAGADKRRARRLR